MPLLHHARAAVPPLALFGLALMLAGCAAPAPTTRGETQVARMGPAEVGQSDVNRMATLGMRDNLDSLIRIADKLYRRNPAEWRKGGAASRDAALVQLRQSIETASAQTLPPDLKGKRDIAALSLALSPEFGGDRVAAFVYGSADMLITAHGGKTHVYLIDSLDAQYIYNAARNIEIAIWLLSSRRNAAGQPLLLADEISATDRNLSFEREFGKIIGRLDLLAEVLTEKYRRAVISYVQNLVGGTFLQFLPVR
ncbi:MAG: putative lipoprotein [Polaromonas sp.]|nr:putative lipoprotein [Polaromonas sp.]